MPRNKIANCLISSYLGLKSYGFLFHPCRYRKLTHIRNGIRKKLTSRIFHWLKSSLNWTVILWYGKMQFLCRNWWWGCQTVLSQSRYSRSSGFSACTNSIDYAQRHVRVSVEPQRHVNYSELTGILNRSKHDATNTLIYRPGHRYSPTLYSYRHHYNSRSTNTTINESSNKWIFTKLQVGARKR